MIPGHRQVRRVKKEQHRMEHGFCSCRTSCTGISLEISSKDEEVCDTCFNRITAGSICLYLHAQRGTQAAQSSWHHVDCASKWEMTATRESKHKQKCIACDKLPESNLYRRKIRAHLSTNMTIHHDCLQKMITLTQEQMLDICAHSVNPSTVNTSYTKMSTEQLAKHGVTQEKLEKVLKHIEKNERLKNVTLEMFQACLASCKIVIPQERTRASYIEFQGTLDRKRITLSVALFGDKSYREYFSSGTHANKRLAREKIEAFMTESFNNDKTFLEFYCKKMYNLPLEEGSTLLLLDNISHIRLLTQRLIEEKNAQAI